MILAHAVGLDIIRIDWVTDGHDKRTLPGLYKDDFVLCLTNPLSISENKDQKGFFFLYNCEVCLMKTAQNDISLLAI